MCCPQGFEHQPQLYSQKSSSFCLLHVQAICVDQCVEMLQAAVHVQHTRLLSTRAMIADLLYSLAAASWFR
jgi:hypothetical protein